jgi:hypothetical protein
MTVANNINHPLSSTTAMNAMRFPLLVLGLAWAAQTLTPGKSLAQAVEPSDDGIAVQARGPVHEAFAKPTTARPQPGPVAPRQPPPPIPEQPPDQKPEGANVQWIPGYWSWDGDKNDFIWVSGFWRAAPPQRRWVAGRWEQTDTGWQFVSGYWAGAGQPQILNLKEPPASLDYGPVVPAPSADSDYVPGYWVTRDDQYLWSPGYWQDFQPGWVWTNAEYCWTPSCYVFVNGYWDYPLERRGLLFAPVCFERPLWTTPGWCFRPRFAVPLPGLLASLFVRPAFGHFFFGDYYDRAYARVGYQPWFAYGARFHDSLFQYYRWQHRGHARWEAELRHQYVARRDGQTPRPPRTLKEQTALLHGAAGRASDQLRTVTPLNQLHGSQVRLQNLTTAQVAEHRLAAERMRAANRQLTVASGGRQLPQIIQHSPHQSAAVQSHPANESGHRLPTIIQHQSHQAATHLAPQAAHHVAAANHSGGHALPTIVQHQSHQAAAHAGSAHVAHSHSTPHAMSAPRPARHAAAAHPAPGTTHRASASAGHGHGSGHKR